LAARLGIDALTLQTQLEVEVRGQLAALAAFSVAKSGVTRRLAGAAQQLVQHAPAECHAPVEPGAIAAAEESP